jgi:hypothetical protein
MGEHIFDLIKKFGVTTVDVGYAKYKLIVTKEIPENEVFGYTNPGTYTIYLNQDMENGPARETLLHEITHAIFEVTGFTSDNLETKFEESNEDLTLKVSRGYMLLINLNPVLMNLLITSGQAQPSQLKV